MERGVGKVWVRCVRGERGVYSIEIGPAQQNSKRASARTVREAEVADQAYDEALKALHNEELAVNHLPHRLRLLNVRRHRRQLRLAAHVHARPVCKDRVAAYLLTLRTVRTSNAVPRRLPVVRKEERIRRRRQPFALFAPDATVLHDVDPSRGTRKGYF